MGTLKKNLLGLSAALLSSTIALETQAIQVAANGIGQVLLAPIYMARDSSERTLITLINTNQNYAVKVKAVIRSERLSTEVADFIIYLTPGDVWRGYIYNKNGQAWLHSNDDSILTLQNEKGDTWSNDVATDVMLFDELMLERDPGDNNEMGHMEFIGHYSIGQPVFSNNTNGAFVNVPLPEEPVYVVRGMLKDDLRKIIDLDVADIITNNLDRCPNRGAYPALSASTCPVRIDFPSTLQLQGDVELLKNGEGAVYKMTALASSRLFEEYPSASNVDIISFSPPFPIPFSASYSMSTFHLFRDVPYIATDKEGRIFKDENSTVSRKVVTGTHVIANPFLEVSVKHETPLGGGWGFQRGEIPSIFNAPPLLPNISYNNTIEIESALATSFFSGSYESGILFEGDGVQIRETGIQVTFPTKYRHRGQRVCENLPPPAHGSEFAPPFARTLGGEAEYKLASFDNSDNRVERPGVMSGGSLKVNTLMGVNLLLNRESSNDPELFEYESGFYKMELIPSEIGCPYPGLPAIAHTYKYTKDGLGNIRNINIVPASSDKWQWQ